MNYRGVIAMKTDLLSFTSNGIYCEKADVYLDPWRPVEKAIITHAHADHSRNGHNRYIAHHHSIPIMRHRLGAITTSGVNWGESFVINGVKFSLHPAGHIIGSSLVRVEHKGQIAVFTGDYKLEDDGLSTPLDMQKCDLLITECTFGLPVFKWQSQTMVFNEMLHWWEENTVNKHNSLIYAYSLGKAQRILNQLSKTNQPILVHPSIAQINTAIEHLIQFKGVTVLSAEVDPKKYPGALLVVPPSAENTKYLSKWGPLKTAVASGWMATRGNRRRRNVDRGFVLSDHCDFEALKQSIEFSGAEKVICTHGFTDSFARHLQDHGIQAQTQWAAFETDPEE